MQRREFVFGLAAGGLLIQSSINRLYSHEDHVCLATHQTVQDAIKSPAERFAFVPAVLVGTDSKHADYMATVDVDPSSKTFGHLGLTKRLGLKPKQSTVTWRPPSVDLVLAAIRSLI